MASQFVQGHRGRQQSACWAGITQLFVGVGGHKLALPDRGCKKRAPVLPVSADHSSSGSTLQDKAAEAAAVEKSLQAPKLKELAFKGPAFFSKVARLIVAAAFTLWRFAPAEERECGAASKKSSSTTQTSLPVLVPKAATSLVALGPKEHTQRKVKPANGAAQFAVIAAVLWQASAVRYHALSFPSGIWVGGHDPHMNPSCSSLFEVARWSVFVAIAVFAAQLALLIFLGVALAAMLQAAPERVQLVLIRAIRFMAGSFGFGLIGVLRVIFAGVSFAILLRTHRAECQACQSLTACLACSCVFCWAMTIYDAFALLAWIQPQADPEETLYDPEKEPLLAAKA